MKTINIKQLSLGAAILIIGILLGRFMFNGSSAPGGHDDRGHETTAETWTCSMHPQIRHNGPGLCPICGMDLVPVSTEGPDLVAMNQIQMTESAMKLADIQTVIVGTTIPEKQVYLPGRIEADERGIANVTAHFSGRVEKLYADFTGQFINRGQPLATLYSPDLVTAQKELFEAMKFKSSNPSFYEAAVQKLKLWELTNQQIRAIEQGGEPLYNFNVYAPRSGTIISRKISEGEHVMDGQTLFEIADLNRLWVLFDAYESDLPWIKVGDSITFNVQSLPGRTFKSMVTFIDPVVNNQTRTASVRTELTNADNQLKPEMFVEGIITAGLNSSTETLMIPKTAVLWTGKRAVVYVKSPHFIQPTFEFREIELGTDAGEYYVVNRGLTAGEEIAANGVFKIDGAAQLQGKFSMMNPTGGRVATSHQHHHMMAEEPGTEIDVAQTYEAPNQFKQQLGRIFKAYLPLTAALVDDDLKAAQRAAKSLLSGIQDTDIKLLSGDAQVEWTNHRRVLSSALTTLMEAEDIGMARKSLPLISDQLYQTLIAFQVKAGVHRIFCPMAFETHGAYWLNDSREIRNPYWGQQMLDCGSVQQVIQ